MRGAGGRFSAVGNAWPLRISAGPVGSYKRMHAAAVPGQLLSRFSVGDSHADAGHAGGRDGQCRPTFEPCRIAEARMSKRSYCLVALLGSLFVSVASAAPAAPPAAYFDNTGRNDVLTRRRADDPDRDPEGNFHVWTKRVGNNPTDQGAAAARRPGRDARILEAFDSYFPGAGHRVLLLRPAGVDVQRSARGSDAVGAAAVRRRGRAGPQGARSSTRTTSTCSANPGAACSRSSTRSSISRTSRGS